MKVEIIETDHNTLLLNGKECYKINDSWQSREQLSNEEQIAFLNYVNVVTIEVTPLRAVLNEVVEERKYQDDKFGKNRDHHPCEWLMILGEEVGEVNRAALETYFNTPVVDAQFSEYGDYSEYRKELIQVAAVAVAMIESIDRIQKKS